MQPVPCWEKVWVIPESAAPGSSLRIYKWVKTDKKQVRVTLRQRGTYVSWSNRSNSVTMKARRINPSHPCQTSRRLSNLLPGS